jgi:hypothetical protein
MGPLKQREAMPGELAEDKQPAQTTLLKLSASCLERRATEMEIEEEGADNRISNGSLLRVMLRAK